MNEIDTLQRAKNDLGQGWKTPDGATCACCGQKVKLYKRKINSNMAYRLICLHRKNTFINEFHHRDKIGTPRDSGGDFAKLRYWGLIEQMANDDTQKRCSGFWRMTDKGRDFVQSLTVVPAYCYMYNQKPHSFSPEMIGIREALGSKFDYPELMGYLI